MQFSLTDYNALLQNRVQPSTATYIYIYIVYIFMCIYMRSVKNSCPHALSLLLSFRIFRKHSGTFRNCCVSIPYLCAPLMDPTYEHFSTTYAPFLRPLYTYDSTRKGPGAQMACKLLGCFRKPSGNFWQFYF